MNDNERFYEGMDRREKCRFRIDANCSFQCCKPVFFFDQYNINRIENIGPGGLSFISEDAYDPKTRMFMTIAIKEQSDKDPINALGEVIWSYQPNNISNKYRIGVKFIKILQDDMMNLSRFFNQDYISIGI